MRRTNFSTVGAPAWSLVEDDLPITGQPGRGFVHADGGSCPDTGRWSGNPLQRIGRTANDLVKLGGRPSQLHPRRYDGRVMKVSHLHPDRQRLVAYHRNLDKPAVMAGAWHTCKRPFRDVTR
jgi:hypothetical protein